MSISRTMAKWSIRSITNSLESSGLPSFVGRRFLLALKVSLWLSLCKNLKLAIIMPSQRRDVIMKRFIEDEDRNQSTLLPEALDDYIVIRVDFRIKVFVG